MRLRWKFRWFRRASSRKFGPNYASFDDLRVPCRAWRQVAGPLTLSCSGLWSSEMAPSHWATGGTPDPRRPRPRPVWDHWTRAVAFRRPISDLKMKGTEANRIDHTHTSTTRKVSPAETGNWWSSHLPDACQASSSRYGDDGDLATAAGRNRRSPSKSLTNWWFLTQAESCAWLGKGFFFSWWADQVRSGVVELLHDRRILCFLYAKIAKHMVGVVTKLLPPPSTLDGQ